MGEASGPAQNRESADSKPPMSDEEFSKIKAIRYAKRITLVIGVVSALIVAGVKLYENITLAMTVQPHVQQLKEDLDKSYERTHRELEKYNNRP